jgi:antitoxin (DNA-binding transcriptional repressor) of toxin-antitoxin stability system
MGIDDNRWVMSKPRRTMPATEVRVRLGEVLRCLASEDIVIEKGGIPVAVLTAYQAPAVETAGRRPAAGGIEDEYERAVSRRAEPRGWERMDKAMAAGWAGIGPDELAANVYRWREEGQTSEDPVWDAEYLATQEAADGGEVPAGQQHLYSRRRRSGEKRVAEDRGPGYAV